MSNLVTHSENKAKILLTDWLIDWFIDTTLQQQKKFTLLAITKRQVFPNLGKVDSLPAFSDFHK